MTPPRQQGFVLVAALWVLAALVVLAAYIDSVATAEVQRATLAKEALQRRLDRRSLENTLLYLLATSRMNHHAVVLEETQRFADALVESELLDVEGDGEILLAGETYAAANGWRFALQDEGGLVSVNFPRSRLFASTLAHIGLPQPAVVALVARAADYIDIDHRLSLNGAEAFDYRQDDLPDPPNWFMASPLELKRVLGVESLVSDAQWRSLRPLLTARPPTGYNINTMHPQVLSGLLDADESALSNLLEARAERPIVGINQIAMLTGRQLDVSAADLRSLPSNFLRISTWHESQQESGGARQVLGVELAPYGLEAPWQKNYRYSEPPAGLSPIRGASAGAARERAAREGSTPRMRRAAPRVGEPSAGEREGATPRMGGPINEASLRRGPLEAPTRLLQ